MTTVHEVEKTRLRSKDWIQTYLGGAFRPLSPTPEDVRIEDIAHALSQKCRFTGHCDRFYSVAQHCVLVSYAVPRAFALPALLHDAGEAYLPDIAAPIKSRVYVEITGGNFYPFSKAEGLVLNAVFEALDILPLRNIAESEQVKKADLQLLATEVRDLMGEPPQSWHLTEEPLGLLIVPWKPEHAKAQFLARFKELTR